MGRRKAPFPHPTPTLQLGAMPVHRFTSGPEENDNDVLERAIQTIEAKGEEYANHTFDAVFPVAELVLITRKAKRTETRTKS